MSDETRGTVVITSARRHSTYVLNGHNEVDNLAAALENFTSGETDGISCRLNGTPVAPDQFASTQLRPGDVVLVLSSGIANAGFKGN